MSTETEYEEYIISVLDEADPAWRDRFNSPFEAAEVLAPELPDLIPSDYLDDYRELNFDD